MVRRQSTYTSSSQPEKKQLTENRKTLKTYLVNIKRKLQQPFRSDKCTLLSW